ncbi:coiled coil domain protein [Legionella steigerwaltii]|uniref:Coiled coil domain protein n=1 Tax=Legionella steigerwaltii TaxID=460 RepID=A0A378L9F0_9GAMM|nr:hypothetical protein [Legionella steigerwaltii]KTD80856.1 coiled coil domain-containing protein [Legionella steigerwaltii]STY23456.1 coiled coil domain protein [Legionella steigerwaltii]
MPSFRQAFFNFLNSQKLTGQFTPEEQEKIYQEYRDSIGLTEDLTFGAEAFDKHIEKRIKDHTGFKTQIGAEKEDTLEKILKGDAPPEKAAVRTALSTILERQTFFNKAQEIYKERMETFQERLKEVPELSVEQIRGYLEVAAQDARNALKAQQKIELDKLKAEAPELAKKIGALLTPPLTSPADDGKIKSIEETLVKDLEKSHSEQLEEFNNTTKENLTTLDKAAALERKRVIFSYQLENWAEQLSDSNKEKMLEEMERARAENRKKRGLTDEDQFTGASINVKDETISAIHPEDLRFIISLTGQEIKNTAKPGEQASWTVEMGPRILSPFYYLSNKQNPKVDMLTMAQAVRAEGFDSITMKINFEEPERKKRARQAYEACLECGFSPDPLPGQEGKDALKGIVLRDGAGNEIKPEDIFSPNELALLHDEAAKRRAKLKSIVEEPPKETTPDIAKQYREELDKGRSERRVKAGKAPVNFEAEQVMNEQVKTTLGTGS